MLCCTLQNCLLVVYCFVFSVLLKYLKYEHLPHCTLVLLSFPRRQAWHHGCTSAPLKVLNYIITAIDKRQYCAVVFIGLAKVLDSVNQSILIDRLNSLGLIMTSSPGLPTTSQIEFSLSNWRACCPDLWRSLWGCHRVHFSGRLFSLCIYQWCRSCCWWFSDPPLHRRHHSVYLWPFFGLLWNVKN